MNPVDLVVFDMVGTTVQSSDAVPQAFVRALSGAGIAPTSEDIASVRGKSKRAAIAELLAGEGDVDTVYDGFRSLLADDLRENPVVPVAGAVETFSWCRQRGIDVALTTGFDLDLAMLVLGQLAWRDIVGAVVCNDEVENGRPAPDLILTAMRRLGHEDVERVASVGDTRSDLEAGANAGVGWNIGVLSGAHSREQLEELPHTALINSVADLPEVLSAG